MSPIVALAIGHGMFGEPIGWPEIIGSVMLLAASALATAGRADAGAARPADGN